MIRKDEMKKLKWLSVALAVLMSFTVFAAACNPDSPSGNTAEYTVAYYDGTQALKTETVKEGDKAIRWTPQKTNFEFDDWYKDAAFGTKFDFDKPITEDTNVFAKFNPIAKQYTVTYYDGSETLKTEKVTEGGKAVNWTPQKAGFVFDGWYKDGEFKAEFSFDAAITADTPVYAKFTDEAVAGQYPVTLAADGTSFTYGFKGEETTVTIDSKNIFVDGSLSDDRVAALENVYNSFNDALEAATDGTEEDPMNLWLAPYVYWIHDPASESTSTAFGITKSCANLHITGLSDYAQNVVIAGNYGHNYGYDGGNWTMFNMSGNGLTLKNVTFGEYCNIDLVYPLNPELNVQKRTPSITQAQIAMWNGDKLYAENCSFISRLNLSPFIGGRRAVYNNCHFESTGDSLNGNAVYYKCDLEFYSHKPFGSVSGVALLDCDVKIKPISYNEGTRVRQDLCNLTGDGYFALVDVRFTHNLTVPVDLAWAENLSSTYRAYKSNVTLNGEPTQITNYGRQPDVSVDITGTEALKAYKLTKSDGKTVYNVYNLVRGTDEWDPLGQKAEIEALEADDIPTKLFAYTSKETVSGWWGPQVSYKTEAVLEAGTDNDTVTPNVELTGSHLGTSDEYARDITWTVKQGDEKYVSIIKNVDKTVSVKCVNDTDETPTVIVTAKDASGLVACISVVAKPSMLPAPTISGTPAITQNADGTATLAYDINIDGGRADNSKIVWSVCDDAAGSNPIEVFVGRSDTPLKTITLNKGFVGMYLQATIYPKHIRCEYGEPVTVTASTPVTANGIEDMTVIHPDLSIMSVANQLEIKDGFWTLDSHKPADTSAEGYTPLDSDEVCMDYACVGNANWSANNSTTVWDYGTGTYGGFSGYTGIAQLVRGARIAYSTLNATTGDMDLTVKAAPGKEGQGFGSAPQYMDFMIKYDIESETGYGLRIVRASGNSCYALLLEYRNHNNKAISEKIENIAFLSESTIHIWTTDGGTKLHATVTTNNSGAPLKEETLQIPASVSLEADITANTYGDICIQHTGTTSIITGNSCYIGDIKIEYKN